MNIAGLGSSLDAGSYYNVSLTITDIQMVLTDALTVNDYGLKGILILIINMRCTIDRTQTGILKSMIRLMACSCSLFLILLTVTGCDREEDERFLRDIMIR